MNKEWRQLLYRCFSCGFETRKRQIIYDSTIPVSFEKCPECGRQDFAFYRLSGDGP